MRKPMASMVSRAKEIQQYTRDYCKEELAKLDEDFYVTNSIQNLLVIWLKEPIDAQAWLDGYANIAKRGLPMKGKTIMQTWYQQSLKRHLVFGQVVIRESICIEVISAFRRVSQDQVFSAGFRKI